MLHCIIFSIDITVIGSKVYCATIQWVYCIATNLQVFVRRKMMEAYQITKQAFDFQKGAFSSWFDVLSILQDQADLTVNTMLNHAGWIPDEDRKVILNWASACKNEGDRYKAYVEESFSGLEKYLVQEIKGVPAKAKKAAAEEIKAASAQKTEQATQ
jgi:hypothetical protein